MSAETPLDSARLWLEFPDPEDVERGLDGERGADTVYRVDLTWLTSDYTCIFGNGCPGIYADAPDVGCCALGAHFTEKADEKRVAKVVKRLTPETWQFHAEGRAGGWTELEDGARKTRVHQGGCILANRPGFAAGAGCALHLQALRDGVDPLTYKPDVCWQLPLKRSYRTVTRGDGSTYLEVSIGEYDRRGWGEGGHDLDWYCTGNPAAHVGTRPVFRSCENELREMIGDRPYEELARHCEALVARSRGGSAHRRLLPLTVHPADRGAQRGPVA
ncbi:hypothetical protein [Kineococcus radiotolerans]|uniref:DUF3109 family protein n=1 Tax=Kineococcus radiotolerans (strain ATCC BAA-149 / DSM 14245 / SRS30216) TaxID=266940 RepID=A6W5K8_KINRD|nr:hypothetical protein [Kineococcus radiotolerans]ABS02097.1 conserved hypothetical protein [Kineococcus radiotolerans SRS30216 = ATCC BAA-149]